MVNWPAPQPHVATTWTRLLRSARSSQELQLGVLCFVMGCNSACQYCLGTCPRMQTLFLCTAADWYTEPSMRACIIRTYVRSCNGIYLASCFAGVFLPIGTLTEQCSHHMQTCVALCDKPNWYKLVPHWSTYVVRLNACAQTSFNVIGFAVTSVITFDILWHHLTRTDLFLELS